MNKFKVVLGDWSGDGHDKTETFVIETDMSYDEVQSAYKNGLEKTGVADITTLCVGYEESTISVDDFERYLNDLPQVHKINYSELTKDYLDGVKYDEEDSIGIYTLEYFQIWINIVEAGKPEDKTLNIITNNDETINIGGYGLFY